MEYWCVGTVKRLGWVRPKAVRATPSSLAPPPPRRSHTPASILASLCAALHWHAPPARGLHPGLRLAPFRYSWHFPELLKIVSDNYMYAALVTLIKRRETLTTESLPMLERVVMDADKAKAVLDASKHSMGMDISVSYGRLVVLVRPETSTL